MNSFRKLNAYIFAKDLVKQVYKLLEKFPREEQYALCDQLRRSVISLPSNIAEGTSRFSLKDKSHFIEIAYGSLMETYSQLQIAMDLQYIEENELKMIIPTIIELRNRLSALRRSYLENKK